MWHTFRHSRYIEHECVYAYLTNIKALSQLKALASTPSPLSNEVKPLYWNTLSSQHPIPDRGQLSAFLFKPSKTKSPGPCWGSLGTEMLSPLRCKYGPVQQSSQFVLVFPATRTSAGIKEFCPHLEIEGQDSSTTHNSDQPQLALISHSWGFFWKKKKRIKSVQTPNNVRAHFNAAGRLFQLFGSGSLKKQSLPPIVSGAPDTRTWIALLKQRADWHLLLDKRTQNNAINKEWTIINCKYTLQETWLLFSC